MARRIHACADARGPGKKRHMAHADGDEYPLSPDELDAEKRMTEQADARGYRTFRIHGATATPGDTGRARG